MFMMMMMIHTIGPIVLRFGATKCHRKTKDVQRDADRGGKIAKEESKIGRMKGNGEKR